MIREDFVETPDGKNRNTENRGKSGYRRASWDEALSLVAREIKRLHKTYGKETITACTSSHHSWGLVGYKISLFNRFFSMMGYTRICRQPELLGGLPLGYSPLLRLLLASRRTRTVRYALRRPCRMLRQ